MSNDENESGDGSGEHPLKLALDINDWLYARKRLGRVLERLGSRVPPPGPHPAAELSQLIAATDVELAREREVWTEIIRPRLKKYEGAPIPPLTML
jgi:hypothetical protein